MSRRLSQVPDVQFARKHWFDHRAIRVGDLCVIALTRKPAGVGTYRLDRIARTEQAPGFSKANREIVEVESGTPITLNRADAWDGERHWFTYSLDTAPSDIRARELWDVWIAAGRPTWRSHKATTAYLREFFVREEAAA